MAIYPAIHVYIRSLKIIGVSVEKSKRDAKYVWN